jgi:hypothetical protein
MKIVSTETKSKNIRKGIEKCFKEIVEVPEDSSFYSAMSELYYFMEVAKKFNREHPRVVKSYIPVLCYQKRVDYIEHQIHQVFDY